MDFGIAGKRAIVTGGSSGIGRCCAVELAREGVQVCIVGRDLPRLAESVSMTRDAGCEGFSVSADLSTAEGCQASYDAAFQRMGGADILINSAGAALPSPVLSLQTSQIDSALGLKLYAALRMSQHVIPGMRAQKWGRIVNIAGLAGAQPDVINLPTSFANVTMMNLTRSLSDEVAGDGVLVNVICPGRTNTPRTAARYQAQAAQQGISLEQYLKENVGDLPAGRIAEPEEVARVATFLSSEPCSYVFATAVYMEGGSRRSTP